MDWTQGYTADVEYIPGFYGELAPQHLALVTLMRGVRPPSLAEGFTYFELGCGQGFTLNLLASCHPQGRFYGNDFNPTHVARAQTLAAQAGLTNVTILEKSFEELLAMDLPSFDYIVLHGIYSWVSPANRQYISDFIRARLRPGGVVYVSYNCLPGWSAAAPVRRLLNEYAQYAGGTLPQRVEQAIQYLTRLEQTQCGFFSPNPVLTNRIAHIKAAARNYVIHEYFNTYWEPFYHADVVAAMAQAKLAYVGPAGITDQFDFLMMSEPALRVLAELEPSELRETVRDFLLNTQFRRDVFTRGKVTLSVQDQRDALGRLRLLLVVPRPAAALTVRFPGGDKQLFAEIYNPILDQLAAGPQTIGNLVAARPPGLTVEQVIQAAQVLLAAGYAMLATPEDSPARQESIERFNRVVLDRAKQNDELQFLASPRTATGVAVPLLDRLFLAAQRHQADPVAFAWQTLQARQQVLLKDGKALQTEEENLAEMRLRLREFEEQRLPRLRLLGLA